MTHLHKWEEDILEMIKEIETNPDDGEAITQELLNYVGDLIAEMYYKGLAHGRMTDERDY